ncbi:hypothetical protein BC831DRAFT_119104 [Entophlyctis helioformis]|nr:hypothetical protein BC831DRAFT_119104 [Entophlyctis helioformis]
MGVFASFVSVLGDAEHSASASGIDSMGSIDSFSSMRRLLATVNGTDPGEGGGSACPVSHSALKLVLGGFITLGLMVSYLPQFSKIISAKSSAGLSVWFLLLGSIGCASTIGNVLLLQMDSVVCCATEWPAWYCFEDTLGMTQVSTQFICFSLIVSLFFVYYPKDSSILLPLDSGDLEPIDIVRETAKWRRVQGIGAIMVTYTLFVLASVLLILQIQDKAAFVQAKVWWAGVLGVVAACTGIVQFMPQIVHTWFTKSAGALSVPMLAMQCPGSFVFAASLAMQPGTNWTSWISFLVGGTLQGLLLVLCLVFESQKRATARRRSSGRSRRSRSDGDLGAGTSSERVEEVVFDADAGDDAEADAGMRPRRAMTERHCLGLVRMQEGQQEGRQEGQAAALAGSRASSRRDERGKACGATAT